MASSVIQSGALGNSSSVDTGLIDTNVQVEDTIIRDVPVGDFNASNNQGTLPS